MKIKDTIFPVTMAEYKTNFTQNEVLQMLNGLIEQKKILRRVDIPLEKNKFEGTLYDNHFDIAHIPISGALITSRILGEIHSISTGSHVVLNMKLRNSYVYSYIFIFILMSVVIATIPYFNLTNASKYDIFKLYLSGILGIVFALSFPFLIGKKVKRVQEETQLFFDNLFKNDTVA